MRENEPTVSENEPLPPSLGVPRYEAGATKHESTPSAVESVRIAGNKVLPADKSLPTLAYDQNLQKLLGKTRIEAWSRTAQRLIPAQQGGYTHAFIDTLNVAYQNHYSISLSPDHLWLLIAQGFATHVNQNPQTLRQRLVTPSRTVPLRPEIGWAVCEVPLQH